MLDKNDCVLYITDDKICSHCGSDPLTRIGKHSNVIPFDSDAFKYTKIYYCMVCGHTWSIFTIVSSYELRIDKRINPQSVIDKEYHELRSQMMGR